MFDDSVNKSRNVLLPAPDFPTIPIDSFLFSKINIFQSTSLACN